MPNQAITILFAALAVTTMHAVVVDEVHAADVDALECRVSYELEAHLDRDRYDHVVHLDSACDFQVACTILNDEGRRSDVVLAPKADVAVTIDDNEVGTDFRAKIRCAPVGDA